MEVVKVGPQEPIEVYCSACWQDRILTTNGKCKVCGTDLVKRHWKTSIKKLEIMLEYPNKVSIEIKGAMYLISKDQLVSFGFIENYGDKIKFIENIKKNGKCFKI